MELPLDEGFLRRECPQCARQFKWHEGPADDRPEDAVDLDIYFCPYCGETAPPDHWWTTEQLEHARQLAFGMASREIGNALKEVSKKRSKKSLVQFKVKQGNRPPTPNALQEPHDMLTVQSPCHPWEPIKIIEGWNAPLHCLICGERFAI